MSITVETDPPEASIYIGDENEARGKGNVTVSLEPKRELSVRAQLHGYRDQSKTITVPPEDQRIQLQLTALPSKPVNRVRKSRRARPRRATSTSPAKPTLPSSGVLE